jgi:hypothetical protein
MVWNLGQVERGIDWHELVAIAYSEVVLLKNQINRVYDDVGAY